MSSSGRDEPTRGSRPTALPPKAPASPAPRANNNGIAWQTPLLLTVRFSTSIPDLLLDIPRPSQTTVIALKHLIRTRLTEPNSQRRLRFIHGGKILPDTAVLGSVLKVPPPPPRTDEYDPKGKGKAVEGRDAAAQRVYVNCSIGDSLTDEELATEAEAAKAPVPESVSSGSATPIPHVHPGGDGSDVQGGGRPNTAGRGPRGFDRLLSAGFTPAEVNQLRLQFRSIQAARHTPDTMPSPDSLRSMEDAWIDNNNSGTGGVGGAGGDLDGVGAAEGGEEFGMNGLLDVLLRGMMIGFVWPLGSIGWLIRGEARLSKRMRIFVGFGFILSLTIGIIRAISGPER